MIEKYVRKKMEKEEGRKNEGVRIEIYLERKEK